MNEMRKLMESIKPLFEEWEDRVKAALAFLDGEIENAIEYETNDDDMGWDDEDDDEYGDDSILVPALRDIRARVAAGEVANEEDIEDINIDVYEATMGSGSHCGDTDLADHIAFTLRDILGIIDEEDEYSSLEEATKPDLEDELRGAFKAAGLPFEYYSVSKTKTGFTLTFGGGMMRYAMPSDRKLVRLDQELRNQFGDLYRDVSVEVFNKRSRTGTWTKLYPPLNLDGNERPKMTKLRIRFTPDLINRYRPYM